MSSAEDPRRAAAALLAELTGPGGDFELVTEEVLGSAIPVFRERDRSLDAVLRRSRRHGDRDYLVSVDQRISFAEHADRVASLAVALRDEYGIGKGDRVAIAAANSPQWIIAFWAAVSLGAIAVGCNAWWSRPELAYAIGHSRPSLLVVDAKRAELVDPPGIPVLDVERDVPRLAARHPGAELPTAEVAEDDPAVLLYTSGTSGRPKAAVHSHRNLIAVIDYHRLSAEIPHRLGDPVPPEDKRYLLALPLFHIASLHNLALPRLATGSAVVIHQGAFDADRVLALVERERVTNWAVVPTQANRLLERGGLDRYDLSALTAFSLASAPSSPALKDRVRALLPTGARQSVTDSYGLTESCTGACVATPADLAEHPDAVGRPVVGVQLEIRDPAGRALPDGEEGEVCLRSMYNMLGYWEDPEATAHALREDRWLHTGDLGVRSGGLLRLSSRRSDLILRGGENVYPAEVEFALADHPAVRECLVLGVADADLGQAVGAVVVTGQDGAVRADELADHLRERLAYFKVPTVWRLTTDPLPRNATGKVVRARVRLTEDS
ncbi:class I adenylate-forming enzyme family protein [Saccharopolyspora sp. CA-218241]|uniref:class I adenylate-forming enzyme family protein n=1 Tax=Saccharopolyspora sp. CA-218241 TaxID=3240027 RepID=UPI003D962831